MSNVSPLSDYQGEQGEVIDGTVKAVDEGEGQAIDENTPAANAEEKPLQSEILKDNDIAELKGIFKKVVEVMQTTKGKLDQANAERNTARATLEEYGLSKKVLPWVMQFIKADDDQKEVMWLSMRVALEAVNAVPQVDWLDEVQTDNVKIELQKLEENLEKRKEVKKQLEKEIKQLRKEKAEMETAQ